MGLSAPEKKPFSGWQECLTLGLPARGFRSSGGLQIFFVQGLIIAVLALFFIKYGEPANEIETVLEEDQEGNRSPIAKVDGTYNGAGVKKTQSYFQVTPTASGKAIGLFLATP